MPGPFSCTQGPFLRLLKLVAPRRVRSVIAVAVVGYSANIKLVPAVKNTMHQACREAHRLRAARWPAVFVLALLLSSAADAHVRCGRSVAHACVLKSSGQYTGTVRRGGGTTFYRFYGRRGSVVHVTLVDIGPSEPCAVATSCGQIIGRLFERDSRTRFGYLTPTIGHNALDGERPSFTFSRRLPANLPYIFAVAGEPSRDQSHRAIPEPYRLLFSLTRSRAHTRRP